jgi:prepilin-type N-terminal cleavage/methylation domain-containing protein/prepilin-type processing-associated H-X9-DG protein
MSRRAFTLIELLVVISIIAVLAAMLLPAISLVRESAGKISCGNRIAQVGTMIHMYASENDGLMAPPLVGGSLALPEWNYPHPVRYASSFLVGQYGVWDTPHNGTVTLNGRDTVFHCPRDPRRNPNDVNLSYGMNTNFVKSVTTSWTAEATRLQSIRRQADSVLLIDAGGDRWGPGGGSPPAMFMVEASILVANLANWGGGPNSNYNWTNWHRKGANMLYFDNHVRFSTNPAADSATGLALFK